MVDRVLSQTTLADLLGSEDDMSTTVKPLVQLSEGATSLPSRVSEKTR
jgi:hypothetical protein